MRTPFETEQLEEDTAGLAIVQEPSLVENPDPVTWTENPGGPEPGDKAIEIGDATVNCAEAESAA